MIGIKKEDYPYNNIVRASYKEGTMTVVWKNGETEKYDGMLTVWHKQPFMERCSQKMEILLSNLWHYNKKWGGAYPDAHLNPKEQEPEMILGKHAISYL